MASPPTWAMDPNSLKIAIAIALFRLKNARPHPSSSSEADAQRWKNKAKERKLEILRLREELKLLEDGSGTEVVPDVISCRCHFFDGCGDFRVKPGDDSSGHWINEVLHRRFLRLVRWKGRNTNAADGSVRRKRLFSDFDEENEIGRLSISIDFLVELADGLLLKGRNYSSYSAIFHQASDFILASLKNLLSSQKDIEILEDIVNGLILRLTGRMCISTECDEPSACSSDVQILAQHLLRKLGAVVFVGQNAVLLVSKKLSAIAERMIFMDPFDDSFPSMHYNIFLMMQLTEFLVSDNIYDWTNAQDFDDRLFEEWVRSAVEAREGLKLLEGRSSLYVDYMDRIIGQLAMNGKICPDLLPILHEKFSTV